MSYKIDIEVFQGPFDLLFHLIDKNEIDIYDIPIARITDQYLHYLQSMGQMDLEVTSEFLVMAATLLSIKAKMLLPKPPKEEEEEDEGLDPRDQLVERLLEYKKFKLVAEYLKEREEAAGRVFTRPVDVEEMASAFVGNDNPLQDVEMADLLDALAQVLEKMPDEEPITKVHRAEITIRDKVKEIRGRLRFNPNGIIFAELFRPGVSRVEVVVTFLALLEIIRSGNILVRQRRNFAEIAIYSREDTDKDDGGEA
ncbi:segregation/condensation protein A [Metallumcola ferriviriculae]|uniref:Segregation and condensation protein A n=1 Tax=Metallumcola ferriviriculae TaxID=3039180 RepID=A0AAU0US05_9FIRM|nr:segregation/condensation protein A [Desulfitibacteraceae bacterium MK1]